MQAGFCVLQNIQAFDKRQRYEALQHPLPLLPEAAFPSVPAKSFAKRISWRGLKPDKMQLDPRLASLTSMNKATNRQKIDILDCDLVKAYRAFEKDVIFHSSKVERVTSVADSRKVRWILIYAILQTLRSATNIPDEVRDIEEVPYHLSVLTAGCPPWKDDRPYNTFLRTQTQMVKEERRMSMLPESESEQSSPISSTGDKPRPFSLLEPDIDHRPVPVRNNSEGNLLPLNVAGNGTVRGRSGTIRRALSTLGNMPQLQHPKPVRSSFHEILVQGYGNGLNTVSITDTTDVPQDAKVPEKSHKGHARRDTEDTIFSQWSKTDSSLGSDSASHHSSTSVCTSPTSDEDSESRRESDASMSKEILNLLENTRSETSKGKQKAPIFESDLRLPEVESGPLQLAMQTGIMPDETLLITKEVSVTYEKMAIVEEPEESDTNAELYRYLSS
jgi:hypothetical protein